MRRASFAPTTPSSPWRGPISQCLLALDSCFNTHHGKKNLGVLVQELGAEQPRCRLPSVAVPACREARRPRLGLLVRRPGNLAVVGSFSSNTCSGPAREGEARRARHQPRGKHGGVDCSINTIDISSLSQKNATAYSSGRNLSPTTQSEIRSTARNTLSTFTRAARTRHSGQKTSYAPRG